ncbi:hypothetical protein [Tsukamurella sp. NPDC003166]|uniref:hypothetical protein n=1 Tax=Tsukamurella sp. NPDC003166 TaxID=3154444 RepID=UPI0033BD7103
MPAQAWVTLAVGMFAAIGVLISWRQKVDADRRAEWWRRVSWAFEQVLSGDSNRESFGWEVLVRLRDSKLATPEDKVMFQSLADRWIVGDDVGTTVDGGTL